MDMEAITTLLGNYCFPIVCCLCLGYLVYDMNKKHEKESGNFADAIGNNTKVMERVLDVLNRIETFLIAKDK